MNNKHLKRYEKTVHFGTDGISLSFYNNNIVFFILEVLIHYQQENSGKFNQNGCFM